MPERHRLSERGADLYETPACAVHALRKVEELPQVIWECACGRGAIVDVLRAAGHMVYATDLVDYGLNDATPRVDFLMEPAPSFAVGAILTNPPYMLANKFVAHALSIVPKTIMLLPLAYLEGTRRSALLDGGHLRRVYVFRNRLPMMHRDGWDGKKAGSKKAYAWFVWEWGPPTKTTIERISWE